MTVCVNMICTFSFAQVIGSAFGLTRAILCDLVKKKKKISLTLQQVFHTMKESIFSTYIIEIPHLEVFNLLFLCLELENG